MFQWKKIQLNVSMKEDSNAKSKKESDEDEEYTYRRRLHHYPPGQQLNYDNLFLCWFVQICGIQCRHIVCNVYYKIIEYVLLHYKVSYSYSMRHNGQATKKIN